MQKEKQVLELANSIIIHSEEKKERLVELFNIDSDKIHIIPNGINKEFRDPSKWRKERERLRVENNWEDKIVFLYNGALEELNGVKFFIKSLLELESKYLEKIKVVILGKGSLQKYIKKISSLDNCIEFLGMVTYDKMPIYYSASDIQVIPVMPCKTWETGATIKLLEGMAMGKIILASDTEGMKQFLNKENSVLFRKGDKNDLKKKICDIIKLFDNYKTRGNYAMETVKHLDWSTFGKKLDDIYKEMI